MVKFGTLSLNSHTPYLLFSFSPLLLYLNSSQSDCSLELGRILKYFILIRLV